jgi:hypothetical protein
VWKQYSLTAFAHPLIADFRNFIATPSRGADVKDTEFSCSGDITTSVIFYAV